jgi:hypothetical protein
MVVSFDSLRVVALYGCVMGSIHGAVIWLQEAIVSPLLMHFLRRMLKNISFIFHKICRKGMCWLKMIYIVMRIALNSKFSNLIAFLHEMQSWEAFFSMYICIWT